MKVEEVLIMSIERILIFSFALIVALISLIISYSQFKGKGFLFNNAYLYAEKQEREQMNKKPHYKQSAVIFLFIGIVALLFAIEIVFATKWMYAVMILMILVTIIYGIVTSIRIERSKL